MAESTIVGNDARGLLAQIYYQLERKADALDMVEFAINDVEAKGILPKERWWSLQRVLYYEKNDYKRVTSILEKLVKHYPKWTYWKQLGGMYGEQEREMDRLVASELVYLNNKFDKESQVMGMAYMYLGQRSPIVQQLLLIRELKTKSLSLPPKTWKYWVLLGTKLKS